MTAVDEVVKKAGVAKGTFYLYFQDKYDLTDQIILRKSTQLAERVLAEIRAHGEGETSDAVGQILLFMDKITDAMVENRPILTLLSTKISTIYDLLMTDDNTAFRDTVQALSENLVRVGFSMEQAQKQLYIILHTFCSVCCNAILYGTPYTVDELRPEMQAAVRKLLT